MIRKLIIVSTLVLTVSILVAAQTPNRVGTAAAQFLKIESGARALAMGGAYAAIVDDPSALYWNVAGIAQIKGVEASFSHTNWIADLTHNFAGVVIPMGTLGHVGFSAIVLDMGEIEQTTIDQPRGTGVLVDAYDLAIGVSYARSMTDYLSVGITGKFVQQTLWDLSARTVGIDVGFLLDTGFRGITLGMALSNFGPDLRLGGRNLVRGYDKWPQSVGDPTIEASLKTTPWPLPTSYRISIAVDVLGHGSALIPSEGAHQLILAVDALHPNDNPEHYSVGMEYSLSRTIFARTGYKGRTDEQGFTVGFGLRTPVGKSSHVTFDYVFADFGLFDDIQQFSVSVAF